MGYQRRVHGDFGPVFTFDSSERAERQPPQHKMAELGLKKKEFDTINFAFDVYDFKGDGKVDAFYVGDLVRACNLNPTLKTIKEIGGGVAKGEKFLTKPDVFPMYKACKDSKDQGGFHDFVEILKLYDKNADDTILEFELFKLLVNPGEKLTKEEAKNLMKELCDPADDDGFIPFKPFLEKMCAAEKNASHFLSLASTKSLHRRTSTFFGATDEPSRTIQEIAGFIEIHSRDRGR